MGSAYKFRKYFLKLRPKASVKIVYSKSETSRRINLWTTEEKAKGKSPYMASMSSVKGIMRREGTVKNKED